MNFEIFKENVATGEFPADASVCLQALWHDANGNWEQAHVLVQDVPDKNAAWIHAYLHRKEGDLWNADYWYRKAGRSRPLVSLEEEWEAIAAVLSHS